MPVRKNAGKRDRKPTSSTVPLPPFLSSATEIKIKIVYNMDLKLDHSSHVPFLLPMARYIKGGVDFAASFLDLPEAWIGLLAPSLSP